MTNCPIWNSLKDIDDGTGVITAVQFVQKRILSQNQRQLPETLRHIEHHIPISNDKTTATKESIGLASLLRKTAKCLEQSRNSFKIGTCVEAKGRIQHFQETVQLLAFSIREINDPNQEMIRYIRLEQMKKHVYPKTFYSSLKYWNNGSSSV